jgi:hypothetical protein
MHLRCDVRFQALSQCLRHSWPFPKVLFRTLLFGPASLGGFAGAGGKLFFCESGDARFAAAPTEFNCCPILSRHACFSIMIQ